MTTIEKGQHVGELVVMTLEGEFVRCLCSCGAAVRRTHRTMLEAVRLGRRAACDRCRLWHRRGVLKLGLVPVFEPADHPPIMTERDVARLDPASFGLALGKDGFDVC